MDEPLIVFGVFANGLCDDYYPTVNFVDVFSTREKAQAHIDGIIHQRKLDCKREELARAFSDAWEKEHPTPYEDIRATRPKFNQALLGDRAYNQEHAARVREWRKTVELPYNARIDEHTRMKYAAIGAYMETIDIDKQDLSDVDLESYDKENNLFIKELEVK